MLPLFQRGSDLFHVTSLTCRVAGPKKARRAWCSAPASRTQRLGTSFQPVTDAHRSGQRPQPPGPSGPIRASGASWGRDRGTRPDVWSFPSSQVLSPETRWGRLGSRQSLWEWAAPVRCTTHSHCRGHLPTPPPSATLTCELTVHTGGR